MINVCSPGFRHYLPPRWLCTSLINPVPTGLAMLLLLIPPRLRLNVLIQSISFLVFRCPPSYVWPVFGLMCSQITLANPLTFTVPGLTQPSFLLPVGGYLPPHNSDLF